MLQRWFCLLAVSGVLWGVALADDPKTPPAKQDAQQETKTPKETFAAIQKDWNDKQGAFSKKYREAKAEDRQKLFETDYPKIQDYLARINALVEKWPDAPEAVEAGFWALSNGATGKDAAKVVEILKTKWLATASLDAISTRLRRYFVIASPDLHQALLNRVEKEGTDGKVVPVLIWVARHAQYGSPSESTKKANALLLEKFLDSKEIGQLCSSLADSQDPKTVEHLKNILEKNKHDDVKIQACLALGKQLGKVEATQPEAVKYLERAMNEFPNANKNVKNMAKNELFELRFLSIGKVAPDILGKDLDDKSFKLSDYRGKVVLLDFWGFW